MSKVLHEHGLRTMLSGLLENECIDPMKRPAGRQHEDGFVQINVC